MTAPRLAPGDLAELRLDGALGHALVTHVHPVYGEVVRAFGARAARPADLAGLAAAGGPVALFPLGAALAGGRVEGEVIARIAAPQSGRFPGFRIPVRDRSGAPIYWWLWDGGGVTPCDDDGVLAATPVREVLSPAAFLALFAPA